MRIFMYLLGVILFLSACSSPASIELPAEPQLGDSLIRPADGMEMVFVPSGSFIMGVEPEENIISESVYNFEYSKPNHRVKLSAFWIDKTGVTNAQFAEYLNQEGNQENDGEPWLILQDKYVMIEQNGDNFQPVSGFEDYPVIRVTWFGAAAYCNWAGARLPTEAEREYAERGPDGRKYPWGNEEPSYFGSKDNDYLSGIEPVGNTPQFASWVGAMDLEGNTFEWVNDWFSPEYYSDSPAEDPQGPETGEMKVVRGATWAEQLPGFYSMLRQAIDPNYGEFAGLRFKVIGFRCALSNSQ